MLTKCISQNLDRITSETEKAMVSIFSPLPTCSINDISTTRSNGSGGDSSASHAAAKESKVVIQRGSFFASIHRWIILNMCCSLTVMMQMRKKGEGRFS